MPLAAPLAFALANARATSNFMDAASSFPLMASWRALKSFCSACDLDCTFAACPPLIKLKTEKPVPSVDNVAPSENDPAAPKSPAVDAAVAVDADPNNKAVSTILFPLD